VDLEVPEEIILENVYLSESLLTLRCLMNERIKNDYCKLEIEKPQ